MITKGISVIAEHFGLEMQLKQLQEESAELIVAASKFLRKRGDFDYMLPDSFADCSLNLTEELADVLIVAYQIIDLLDAESQVKILCSRRLSERL